MQDAKPPKGRRAGEAAKQGRLLQNSITFFLKKKYEKTTKPFIFSDSSMPAGTT
jgi:hypothetical protein